MILSDQHVKIEKHFVAGLFSIYHCCLLENELLVLPHSVQKMMSVYLEAQVWIGKKSNKSQVVSSGIAKRLMAKEQLPATTKELRLMGHVNAMLSLSLEK